MNQNIFNGAIPAVMTPCGTDRKPAYNTLVRKDKELIAAGMPAVVYCGLNTINLRPQLFAIQAIAPGMIEASGGSISWEIAQGGTPGYTTAKAAVYGLTRTTACDLGQSNIRINTIISGAIMAERQLEKWITPGRRDRHPGQSMFKAAVAAGTHCGAHGAVSGRRRQRRIQRPGICRRRRLALGG